MKQNKKPTYQELEEEIEGLKSGKVFYRTFLITSIIISTFLFIWTTMVDLDNQQLKSQLSNTEGKNYSCNFVGAIKLEDNRICEDENKTICSNKYLGFCFDNSSEDYKYDLINKEYNSTNFNIVSKIKYMEENDIKIYGLSTCPACKKQLSEFGKYSSILFLEKLFINCDKVNDKLSPKS